MSYAGVGVGRLRPGGGGKRSVIGRQGRAQIESAQEGRERLHRRRRAQPLRTLDYARIRHARNPTHVLQKSTNLSLQQNEPFFKKSLIEYFCNKLYLKMVLKLIFSLKCFLQSSFNYFTNYKQTNNE